MNSLLIVFFQLVFGRQVEGLEALSSWALCLCFEGKNSPSHSSRTTNHSCYRESSSWSLGQAHLSTQGSDWAPVSMAKLGYCPSFPKTPSCKKNVSSLKDYLSHYKGQKEFIFFQPFATSSTLN